MMVSADSTVFRLGYRFTVILLLASAAILGFSYFLGRPLKCIELRSTSIKSEQFEAKCWDEGLAVMEKGEESGEDSDDDYSSYPGYQPPSEEDYMYLRRFKWTLGAFVCLAAMMYIPKLMWDAFEAGKLNNLIQNPTTRPSWVYALVFYFCQLLNLVLCFVAIHTANTFISGSFTTVGARLDALRVDTMGSSESEHLLPTTIKCSMSVFGPSGTIERQDTQCAVTINAITEQVWFIVWTWIITYMNIVVVYLILEGLICLVPMFKRTSIKFGIPNPSTAEQLGYHATSSDLFWIRQMAPHASLPNMEKFAKSIINNGELSGEEELELKTQ